MDDPAGASHVHRALLQAFLSQSVMTDAQLKPLLAAILTVHSPDRPTLAGDITPHHTTTHLQAVNARLSPLDYEIRSGRDQRSHAPTYALVNTASDAFTQLATAFSPDEIAYVKRLLDAMFEESNTRSREVMAITAMRATQLAKAPTRSWTSRAASASVAVDDDDDAEPGARAKSISPADSDRVLARLVAQGFFHISPARYYSLAPRALLELRAYLKDTYNDPPAEEEDDDDAAAVVRIRDCEGCRDIVTVGLRCNRRECGVRWHDGCAAQYFRRQQGGASRCPKCNEELGGDVFVGERADRAQGRGSAVRRVGGTRREEEKEGEEEEEEEGEEGEEQEEE